MYGRIASLETFSTHLSTFSILLGSSRTHHVHWLWRRIFVFVIVPSFSSPFAMASFPFASSFHPLLCRCFFIVIGHKMVSLRTFRLPPCQLWQALPGLTLPSLPYCQLPFLPRHNTFLQFYFVPQFLRRFWRFLPFGPLLSSCFCQLHLISNSFIKTPRLLWSLFYLSLSICLS